ncbi:phage exclusion protein Lit family protein [Gimesia sp.]|uniref:phage exclusion protein Lit family protein n=1 Tax=Gimesia sp. TaxID=2024833 RepID=UPI003A8F940C
MADDFGEEVRELLRQITPQRSNELNILTEGVTFRKDENEDGIGFYASSNLKLVRVTMRCQARLWAHCYAYYCMFTEYAVRQSGADSGLSSDQLQVAGDFLEWAVESDIQIRLQGGSGIPVVMKDAPKDAPLPFENINANVVQVGSETIFLNALAFIIHHELAHIQLGHVGVESDLSIQQEYDADATAAEWILGVDVADEFDYLVRHLGVAIALLWFTSLAFREKFVIDSHPPSWKRLLAALEPTVKGEEDAVWGFVVLALTLHFHRYGLSLDTLSEVTHTRATVVEMVETIEQFNAGLGKESE